MTDEQKKLVEDNHSLIYLVINNMGVSIEENYDIAAIALCNAAIRYNPKEYAFSTYACKCIKNEIMKDFVAGKRQKRALYDNLISYDAPLCSSYDDGEEINLLEQIKSKVSVEDEVLSKIMYSEVVEQLGKADNRILRFFEKGLKQKEIAEILGVTQQRVSIVKRRVEKMLCCD